jgi:hypothetical protein
MDTRLSNQSTGRIGQRYGFADLVQFLGSAAFGTHRLAI